MNGDSGTLPTSNPYPGLRPFRIEEDYLFFGREQQTGELLRLLRKNRFLAVVGASGSGKSSLVRAGLVPALHRGTMEALGTNWEITVSRPGGAPLTNLARAFCDADLYDSEDPESVPRIVATLRHSTQGLVDAYNESDLDHETNLLVVIDQFEELFRFARDDVERRDESWAFARLLLEASASPLPIYVVVTMRSDYLGECSQIRDLAEAVNAGEYLIPRLNRDQLRSAIEGPARVGGGAITKRLVQRLLNDVGDDNDQLPVLQHALMRTWDARKDGDPLDLEHYESIGGVSDALSKHADEIYEGLTADHRPIAERVFKTLTEKGADNRGIRRPTRFRDLVAITGGSRNAVLGVVHSFRAPGVTFLMPGAGTDLEDDTVVDLSHESLMRVWQRLRTWVDEESQSARIYSRLAETAILWQDAKAGLYRDPDLQIASSWREETQPTAAWANLYGAGFEVASEFLDQSREAVVAIEREREATQKRELEQAQALAASRARTAKLLKGFATAIGIACVLAIGLAIWAWQQSGIAREQTRVAKLESDRANRAESEAKELAAAARHAQGRTWVANAQTLAESKEFFSARLKAARAVGFDGYGREGLSEDQRRRFPVLLAEGADQRRARQMVDGTSSRLLLWQSGSVPQHERDVRAVALSPDGFLIASLAGPNSGELPDLKLWDASSGALLDGQRSPTGTLNAMAFAPNGEHLILAGDALDVWRVDDRKLVLERTLPVNSQRITSAAFSSDGSRFAVGDQDGQLYVLENVQELASFPDEPALKTLHKAAPIIGLVFHPRDKDILASCGLRDTSVVLTDVRALTTVARLNAPKIHRSGSDRHAAALAFSPDGSRLAVVGTRIAPTLWDVAERRVLSTLLDDEWDTALAEAAARNSSEICVDAASAAFSPDGSQLAVSWRVAAGGADLRYYLPTTSILDLSDDPTRPKRVQDVVSDDSVHSIVRFTRDGQRLVLARKGRLQLWSLAEQRPIDGEPVAHSTSIRSLAFSRDGLQFAAGGHYGVIRVWDARTGTLRHTLRGHIAQVSELAFSRDGTRLFSVGFRDRQFRTWDLTTGALLRTIEARHPVEGLDVSHDDRHIVIGGWSTRFRFFNTETLEEERVLDLAHGNTPRFLSEDQQLLVFRSPGATTDMVIYDLQDDGSVADVAATPETRAAGAVDVVVSPKGNQFAVAFDDGVTEFWERREGGEWAVARELRNSAGAIAYDPTGDYLLTGSASGAQLWNVGSGELLESLPAATAVTAVAVSPNGQLLLVGDRTGVLRMWSNPVAGLSRSDISVGASRAPHPIHRGSRSVALARQRRLLFTTGISPRLDVIHAWKIQPDGRLRTAFRLSGHSSQPGAMALSPDERYLVSGPNFGGGEVILWDLETGAPRVLMRAESVPTFAFSRDGRTLAFVRVNATEDGPRQLILWDLKDGVVLAQSPEFTEPFFAVSFSPDGSKLVVSVLEHEHPVLVYDVRPESRELTVVRKLEGTHGRSGVLSLSDDGELLAVPSIEGGHVRVWAHPFSDNPTSRVVPFDGPAVVTAISPDGRWLATGGCFNRVRVLRADGTDEVVAERNPPEPRIMRFVSDLAFDDDSETLFVSQNDGRVFSWRFLGGSASSMPAATYLSAFPLEEASGGLASILNPRLSPATSPSVFVDLKQHYLPGLRDRPDADPKVALFEYYLANNQFLPAEGALHALGDAATQEMWSRLVSALANDMIDGRAGSEEPLETEKQLATRLFPRFADSLNVQLALFIAQARWSDVGELLRAQLPQLPAVERSAELALFFERLGSHVARLPAEVTESPVKNDLIPARELMVAAALNDLSQAYSNSSSANRWAGTRGMVPAGSVELLLDQLDSGREVELLAPRSTWKYFPTVGAPGDGWQTAEYDDSAWDEGKAPLGYGRLAQSLRYGTRFPETVATRATGQLAYYFRTTVQTPEGWDNERASLSLSVLRDDGVCVYVDGREIFRDNLPPGEITDTTEAVAPVGRDAKATWIETEVPVFSLGPGRHTIAVEVHQFGANSSDILLDLRLYQTTNPWRREETLDATRAYIETLGVGKESFPWLGALDDEPRGPPAEYLWGLRSRVYARLWMFDEALLAIDERRATLANLNTPASWGESRRLLLWKESLLKRMRVPQVELDSVRAEYLAIAPRPSGLDPRMLDLSEHYTQSLTAGSLDLKGLPESFTPKQGVSFDLRGVIRLNSGTFADGRDTQAMHPNREILDRVEGISVGQMAKSIHFLMSSSNTRERDPVELATIEIHYEDGTQAKRPVRFPEDVVDWWQLYGNHRVPEERIGWKGYSRAIGGFANVVPVHLSEVIWENPHPDRKISHLNLISAKRKASVFVVAVTCR